MIFLLAFAIGAIWIAGRMFFGTFIVDPFMIVVLSYTMTRFIYTHITPRFRISGLRRFFVLLAPVSFITLALGMCLPYFNLVDSGKVYFGLLPQWFVGSANGNDFMWNGLGFHLLFGKKLVPAELLPTYRHFWFNVLAVFGLGLDACLMVWAILEGNARALVKETSYFRGFVLEWCRIVFVGIAWSTLMAALASLLVRYYS
jgi:hypothetical protein